MARGWIQAVAGGLAVLLMAAAPVAAQPKPPAKAPVATPAAAPVQKTFSRLTLASDAVRLDAALKAEAPTPLPPAAQSRRKGEALLQAEKPVEALPPLAAAVAADPADPANWLFSKDKPNVIAYGERIFTEATAGDGMIEFEIPIEYYKTDIKPSNIIVVASASRYGDYYTGGQSSTMWLDDLQLVY